MKKPEFSSPDWKIKRCLAAQIASPFLCTKLALTVYIILKQREINAGSKILFIRDTFEEKFYKIWEINTFANKYDMLITIQQIQEKLYSFSECSHFVIHLQL